MTSPVLVTTAQAADATQSERGHQDARQAKRNEVVLSRGAPSSLAWRLHAEARPAGPRRAASTAPATDEDLLARDVCSSARSMGVARSGHCPQSTRLDVVIRRRVPARSAGVLVSGFNRRQPGARVRDT